MMKVSAVKPLDHLVSPFRALFSTHIVGDEPILVRDFVHSALYDPKHGYFSQRSRSVGVLERSIKFNQLEGRYLTCKGYLVLLNSDLGLWKLNVI
ncbi:hypothetical protein TorRG33x02_115990 [Trema orientale]|uniref:Uncharacterized protein n=1 Tax=Trema orientale TaxID=63057 RepID=A0A2P5F3Z5_TREOI|nr:hypothetical protein TorRG33x02_115990 [Trema orientale]